MKRTPLRKKSKRGMKPMKDKADRQLQDHYRFTYPDEKCESCGGKYHIMHHFVEKSQSSRLRYEHENLIFLCNPCHFRHHRTGDASIMAKVILRRGEKWLKNLMTLKREYLDINKKSFLEAIIEKYHV